MKDLPSIRDFILSEKPYFASKGIDIDTVRRKYRREVGMSVDRNDCSSALTSMKRDGILKVDKRTMQLKFTNTDQ